MATGILAIESGRAQDAHAIFKALRHARPQSEAPLICLAVSLIDNDQLDAAVEVLRNGALLINPNSDLAKTFLAMALKFKGVTYQANDLLDEVLGSNQDAHAVRIAKDLRNTVVS